MLRTHSLPSAASRAKIGATTAFTVRGNAFMGFARITVDPDKLGGVPCIRGLRIPVATVVDLFANGLTREEILQYYPDLEPEDIDEALRFAAEAVRERELPLAGGQ